MEGERGRRVNLGDTPRPLAEGASSPLHSPEENLGMTCCLKRPRQIIGYARAPFNARVVRPFDEATVFQVGHAYQHELGTLAP